MSDQTIRKTPGWVINVALLGAIVVLFIASFWLGNRFFPGEFGGTDAAATEAIEATGYTPWFTSLFTPGSGEIESGLFALQAAIGAGLLGFVLGWFACKSKLARK